ncbi:family 1 putative carbohydrate esterase [Podospora fimiseda]|uniref:feruloyl esterase n=1 Tax=Podospora fimiseda TaxID=252190 RepID=A0AAN7BEP4_9PEZI|nr:family 1 putative carbohydrate esterase [Podospora fimiseda]
MHLSSFTVLALSVVAPVLGARSPGCGKNPTIRSGTYRARINNKDREYIVRVPDNYDRNQAYRFVFTFHALGGNAAQIANGGGGTLAYYGLPPLMTGNNSAIFVSPNGLNQGWGNTGGEDITFVDHIVKTIEDDLCVEQSLRFATGFSYGGAMSYSWACSRPNDVRAISVLSSAVLSGCNGGTQPVAYYHQHGTRDSVLSIQMGRQMRDRFIQNNRCTPLNPEPQPGAGGRSNKVQYQNCLPDKPATWVIFDGDHNPSQQDPGSNTPFAPGNTWEFWSQFKAKDESGNPVQPPTTSEAPTQPQPPTTTLITTTQQQPQPTEPAPGPASPKWGQCGGNGWTGPTRCESGSTCQRINDWYHQCL